MAARRFTIHSCDHQQSLVRNVYAAARLDQPKFIGSLKRITASHEDPRHLYENPGSSWLWMGAACRLIRRFRRNGDISIHVLTSLAALVREPGGACSLTWK